MSFKRAITLVAFASIFLWIAHPAAASPAIDKGMYLALAEKAGPYLSADEGNQLSRTIQKRFFHDRQSVEGLSVAEFERLANLLAKLNANEQREQMITAWVASSKATSEGSPSDLLAVVAMFGRGL